MKYTIEQLRSVKGIGSKTIERIIEQFDESEHLSEYDSSIHIEPNSLVHGDMLEVMNGIPDKSVDLVLTDPPYRVISGGKGTTGDGSPSGMLSKNDGKIFIENDITISQWGKHIYRVMKDNSHLYVMVNSLNLNQYISELERVGFELHNVLIWKKNNVTPSRWYMKNAEYILFMRKGTAVPINNPSSKMILEYSNIIGNKLHPTEKPLGLMEELIFNSSHKGDIVLDVFMGSGTTCLGAKNLGRKYIGIELDKDYFEVAKKRIEG